MVLTLFVVDITASTIIIYTNDRNNLLEDIDYSITTDFLQFRFDLRLNLPKAGILNKAVELIINMTVEDFFYYLEYQIVEFGEKKRIIVFAELTTSQTYRSMRGERLKFDIIIEIIPIISGVKIASAEREISFLNLYV